MRTNGGVMRRTPQEWRDSMTRVTGALVIGVQSAFAANWVYCCGEVIAGPRFYPPAKDSGPALGVSVVSSPSDAQQPIRLLFWLSFINARRRLWIVNSYFIPDRHLRKAVKARARAGVDVRILVPGNHTDAIPVQYAGRGVLPGATGGGGAGLRVPGVHDARQDRGGGRRLVAGRLGQHGRAQHGDQRGEPARDRGARVRAARSPRGSSWTSPGRRRSSSIPGGGGPRTSGCWRGRR